MRCVVEYFTLHGIYNFHTCVTETSLIKYANEHDAQIHRVALCNNHSHGDMYVVLSLNTYVDHSPDAFPVP